MGKSKITSNLHGDPLSPYIFILVADMLSRSLVQKAQLRVIKGYKISRRCEAVTHVQFADDIIVFGRAEIEEAMELKCLLNKYCQASGQRINLTKSSILYSSKTPFTVRTKISNVMRVDESNTLSKYLGVLMEWVDQKPIFTIILLRG